MDKDPAVSIIEQVPLDVFDVILSHAQDTETLRSCALVCSSWLPLARPHLFRGVVYRPAVPSRTFKDLLAFLSTLPQPDRFLRAVTVDGTSRDGQRQLELSVEEITAALAQLPTATRITLSALHLTADVSDPRPPPTVTRVAEMVRIEDCTDIWDGVPLRHLLSHFERIDALVLKRVAVRATRRQLPAHSPVQVQLGSVLVTAVAGSSDVLSKVFDGIGSESSPASICMVPTGGILDRLGLRDIVSPFTLVRTLTVNVLSLTFKLKWITEGLGRSPPPTRSDVPKEWIQLDLSRLSSLHTLVLYSTTSSLLRRGPATLLYAGVLANNWRLLSKASTSLRHIELRFQRYGPHWRDTIDELWAIDDLEPSLVRWETVDAGVLARFPDLESFTCVLCDRGFVEQWGPIKGLPATPRSVHSRHVEFDDYVVFLRDAFPRLHAAGRLQFRLSDVG